MLDWADLCEADWEQLCTNEVTKEERSSSSHVSEGGLTSSDPEANGGSDSEDRKASIRRKKSRDKEGEINAALDPIRYKTKMCKNWQLHGKCPYGPRCLFAHGPRDMRSCSGNIDVIAIASNCPKPEETFYLHGKFPSFMPIPTLNNESIEEIKATEKLSQLRQMNEGPYTQTAEGMTFSPETPVRQPRLIYQQVPTYITSQWMEVPVGGPAFNVGYPIPEWSTVPIPPTMWCQPGQDGTNTQIIMDYQQPMQCNCLVSHPPCYPTWIS